MDQLLGTIYAVSLSYFLKTRPTVLKETQIGQEAKNMEETQRLVPRGINPNIKRSLMPGNLPVNSWRDLRHTLNKFYFE
jgi:hypothetical protein